MFVVVDEEGAIYCTSKITTADRQMADDGLVDIVKVTVIGKPLQMSLELKRYHNEEWEDIEEWDI